MDKGRRATYLLVRIPGKSQISIDPIDVAEEGECRKASKSIVCRGTVAGGEIRSKLITSLLHKLYDQTKARDFPVGNGENYRLPRERNLEKNSTDPAHLQKVRSRHLLNRRGSDKKGKKAFRE